MPSSVENRVVQMTFDNARFEQKLNQTMQSIAGLEKSLQFEKSKKGLQGLAAETNKFNLGAMPVRIEEVSKKFLALSTIAVTSLANITTAALKAGANIVKSLSLELVIDGFHEYETNIGSIQTILANTSAKGSDLNDVTAALDDLNTFSDKTIYNFGQMTKNIGTFTAAGVDLDTSVKSIKGIANLAAISGSSAEQAASAMYQLSQAISTGTLKLIDWNSVVNAGLGGEVFQTALFESGKAMKTLKDVPIDMTFKQWTKAGNTFRGSLEEGWLTSEVLTNTLQGFTGDLTEAQILALGYTKQQAKEIQRLGALGVESATKVRTLTQLLSTVKEAVGSGWSQSFKLVFGDFEEATTLFTDISNAIGKMVGNSADARNDLLKGWKNFGGRIILIEGLKSAFKALAGVVNPIRLAFKNIFPPLTAKRLFELTQRFAEFTRNLKPSGETMNKIARVFMGIFSVFKIGIEILKGVGGVVKTLFKSFSDNTNILDSAAKIGDFVVKIKEMLVEGGAIKEFFKNVTKFIQDPMPYIEELKFALLEFFTGLPAKITPILQQVAAKVLNFFANLTGFDFLRNLKIPAIPGLGILEGLLDRLSQRFDQARAAAEKYFDLFKFVKAKVEKVLDVFKTVLGAVFRFVSDFFSGLGDKLAAEMKPGDFDSTIDAVNVGLLGAIALLLKKFLDNGLKFDFGGGFMSKLSGVVDQIGKSIGQLTGVLKAMETNLKAEALMKIAIAIGILTASLLVLSLIDSASLTKALTAMAAGFGELAGMMAILTNMSSGPKGAAEVVAVASALVLMASAILILSGAVKVMSTMNPEELTRGLAGIAGGLGIMVAAVKLVSGSGPSVILAAGAMVIMAAALTILGGAMLIFATMSWKDIGKGLTVMAGGLLIIGIALAAIPASALLVAPAILLVALAMDILAPALILLGKMSWKEIGKSLTVLAGALLILAVGLTAMIIAVPGAVALGIAAGALVVFAGAMKLLGMLSWKEIGKGLAVIAALLLILALGMDAMLTALPGAIALVVITGALFGLVKIMQMLGGMKTGDIVRGLAALAGVLALLGIAANLMLPLIPAMLALGAALIVIGAGFALFGLGAILVAQAIQILAQSGKAGMDAIFTFMDGLIERFPKLATLVATSILNMATTLLEGAVPLVKALGVLLGHILDKLTELLPKLGVFIAGLIDEIVKLVIDKSPALVEAGLTLITNFLKGVRDHIGEIVDIVADIIVAFLQALQERLPDIQDAGIDLVVAYLKGIGRNLQKLIDAGTDLVVQLLKGIAKNTKKIIDGGMDIVTTLIEGIGKNVKKVIDKGTDVLVEFLKGIGENSRKIITAAGDLILDILDAIADAIELYAPKIRDAGWRIGVALLDGLTFGVAGKALDAGKAIFETVTNPVKAAGKWLGINSPSKVMFEMGENMILGLTNSFDQDTSVESSVLGLTEKTVNTFQTAISGINFAGMEEFNPTITPVLDLSSLQKDSKQISGFFNDPNLGAVVAQAKAISSLNQENLAANVIEPVTVPQTTEIRFEQNINAPKQLSTADIYRQTRNQLAMAKEELNIP